MGGSDDSLQLLTLYGNKLTWGCTIHHLHGSGGMYPFVGWEAMNDDSGPFHRFEEDGFGAASSRNTEDGVTGLLNLGVDGVGSEEEDKVLGGGPLGGVDLDVEGRTGPVDLIGDSFNGEVGSCGGVVVLVESDQLPLA